MSNTPVSAVFHVKSAAPVFKTHMLSISLTTISVIRK